MAVIFAVDGFMKSLYEDLSEFIQGENYVETLTKDATSLQDIVTEQYRKIKSTIKLEVEYGCQMAIARFLDRTCLALQASGLWLCYATLQMLSSIWQP